MHIYCMHKLIQECASIISNEWETENIANRQKCGSRLWWKFQLITSIPVINLGVKIANNYLQTD